MKLTPLSIKFAVLSLIRFVLLLGIITSFVYGRHLVLLMTMIAFFLTFVPFISSKIFKVHIPAGFEVIVLFFLYGVFIFAEMRGFYAGFFWIGILLTFISGILLGFVALTIIYALEEDEMIELTPFIIVAFTFCFSLSIGAMWEIFEYFIDTVFGFGLQYGSLDETMIDLIIYAISALLISILGFYNYKHGRRLFSNFLFVTVRKNNSIFGHRRDKQYFSQLIDRIISHGEGEKVEFKATLRKNLHTNEVDKKMEHSVLKTIAGFIA
jgi:hypothetical protein